MASSKLEMLINTLLNEYPAFGGNQEKISGLHLEILNTSHEFFYNNDSNYRNFSKILGTAKQEVSDLSDAKIPFLPSDYFKWFAPAAIKKEQNISIQSSGTTNTRSVVSLDLRNAQFQRISLSKILTHFLGVERKHLFVINNSFSDRKGLVTTSDIAARGMALVAKKTHFISDRLFSISHLKNILSDDTDQPFILFGMTYELFQAIKNNVFPKGSYENMIVVHGGGWKKLHQSKLGKSDFYNLISETWGTKRIHDYYGMAEQAGSIFFECIQNNYHVSNYSNVVVRDAGLGTNPLGETGVLHTFSFIQSSYPGVSILTQDLGSKTLLPNVSCQCGTSGAVISIEGRIVEAEVKGCSDASTS